MKRMPLRGPLLQRQELIGSLKRAKRKTTTTGGDPRPKLDKTPTKTKAKMGRKKMKREKMAMERSLVVMVKMILQKTRKETKKREMVMRTKTKKMLRIDKILPYSDG